MFRIRVDVVLDDVTVRVIVTEWDILQDYCLRPKLINENAEKKIRKTNLEICFEKKLVVD